MNAMANRSKSCCVVDTVALILVIVGGLNWGLVGAFDFDLVAALFGEMSVLSRIVYILVGVSAIWTAIRTPRLIRSELHGAEAPPSLA